MERMASEHESGDQYNAAEDLNVKQNGDPARVFINWMLIARWRQSVASPRKRVADRAAMKSRPALSQSATDRPKCSAREPEMIVPTTKAPEPAPRTQPY